MSKQTQIIRAAMLGTQAHKAGCMPAPCLDSELMKMIQGRQIGETPKNEASTLDLMSAWQKSWHAANLAAQA